MASLANTVVRSLKLAISEPGLLFIICSTGCNFGGVANGEGMLFTATEDWLPSELLASLPCDVQPCTVDSIDAPDSDCQSSLLPRSNDVQDSRNHH